MTKLVGMIFSARPGGNLHDLAQGLFASVAAQLPDVETQLIEIARHKVSPCNGCNYECLLGKVPGADCPIEDDVLQLWHAALSSDLLVYFIPTYGGMPPATWVAFQQRYHAVFGRQPADANPNGKVAVLTMYDPRGTRAGDISQQTIIHNLAGQPRQLVSLEQIIASNYGASPLRDRLVHHEGVQVRLAAMTDRLVEALSGGSH